MAAVAACSNSSPSAPLPFIIVQPLVDSLYAGDSGAAFTATYYLGNGTPGTSGAPHWSSADTTVVTVDSASGKLYGVAPGTAVVSVVASGILGQALVVVTATRDLALLLPEIVMLPQDTFVAPISIRNKGGGAVAPPWFFAPANAVFTIDSATGRIVTASPGAPLPYQALFDTLHADGTVQVVSMGDTTGGGGAYTVNGSVSASRSVTSVRATDYARSGGSLTFLLTFRVVVGGLTTEIVNVLSQTPVTGPDSLGIDSVSVSEAQSNTFLCSPPRSAAAWTSTSQGNPLLAVSRAGGYVKIRKLIPVTGGAAISGSFYFVGQRADYYTDPSGALAIHGDFVAPLITNTNTCK